MVVASGKGGTGKTSVTAAVGCALASLGLRCLMVDADAGMQSLDMALGVYEDAAFDFTDVANGVISLSDAAVPVRGFPTAFVLAAPPDDAEAEDGMLKKLVALARDNYDYILIDAPAGIGAGMCRAAEAAQSALIVATADPICLRSAEKCAQKLAACSVERPYLVVNRVRRDFLRRGFPNLDDAIDVSGVRLIGYVPEDKNVACAGAEGVPLASYARSRACRAAMNIARRITGEHVPLL